MPYSCRLPTLAISQQARAGQGVLQSRSLPLLCGALWDALSAPLPCSLQVTRQAWKACAQPGFPGGPPRFQALKGDAVLVEDVTDVVNFILSDEPRYGSTKLVVGGDEIYVS